MLSFREHVALHSLTVFDAVGPQRAWGRPSIVGKHADLWQEVSDLHDCNRNVGVDADSIHCVSHQDVKGFVKGAKPLHIYVNVAADTFRNEAARRLQVPGDVVERVSAAQRLADRILLRIASIDEKGQSCPS